MKIVVFVLGFLLLLSGCAPEYVVKNQYIPSADENSKVCLHSCTLQKQKCQQRCDEDYSDCLSYAYDSAKKIAQRSKIEYENRHNEYLLKLNSYNFDIFVWQKRYDQRYSDWRYFSDKCSKKRDRYACDRKDELRYTIKKMLRLKPTEPREPEYTTFEQIVASQQQKCSKRCSCNDLYDSCFIGCGGEIVPHKICVKNCDK